MTTCSSHACTYGSGCGQRDGARAALGAGRAPAHAGAVLSWRCTGAARSVYVDLGNCREDGTGARDQSVPPVAICDARGALVERRRGRRL